MKRPDKVHLIGICGTAMGSLATMLQNLGSEVRGSDENVYPPMSDFLAKQKIEVFQGFSASHLEWNPDLVIVGNFIGRGNEELEEVLDRKMTYLSLPETLKLFFLGGNHNLVVTGTHGKTTTTSMLAWIFESAGKNPSFLIGGIPSNFGEGCRQGDSPYWILEGDEYTTAFFDRRSKFMHYMPETLILNNLEYDHADVFANLDEIKDSFKRLVNLVPRCGMILVNADNQNAVECAKNARSQLVEVGFSENAGVRITGYTSSTEGSHFSIHDQNFFIPTHGSHNVHNASMAICAAHFYQIGWDEIRDAMKTFKGVRRRLDVRAEIHGITLIDDFAHHPTALRETILALRARYPSRRLWALFEPRTNSTRRSVFQDSLPEALSFADIVCVCDVARKEQIPENIRLNPEKVVADIAKKIPATFEQTPEAIASKVISEVMPGDVVTAFSNGGFGGILDKLEAGIKKKFCA